jgi:hypothetical protein
MRFAAKVLSLVGLGLCAQAIAGPFVQVTDKAEVDRILAQIPVTDKAMNYRNIGERLANIGMVANSIIVWKFAKKADLETPEDRIGDVVYQISTTPPSSVLTKNYCDMLGSPSYLKRGGKFYPQDRTAVWLMTSKCQLPK